MNIDFAKLLKLLLPTFMRNGLTELVTAVASQFTKLYDEFKAWQIDMRLQAAMTCQVMYLEAILNYRLLGSFIRIITISDGDGVTVDFIVNQQDGVVVDNFRMISLIEKYKTYGKRYRIDQVQYGYQVSWTNPVCELELAVETYEFEWTSPVCEKVEGKIGNMITATCGNHSVDINSQYPVASDLIVNVLVNGSIVRQETIAQGNSSSSIAFEVVTTTAVITSINPEIDNVYDYYFLQEE